MPALSRLAVATIAALDYCKAISTLEEQIAKAETSVAIFHRDVAQYSESYDRLKLGIPTSSNFHKIVTSQGKPSREWREYACLRSDRGADTAAEDRVL
jgi:hypothetical protein